MPSLMQMTVRFLSATEKLNVMVFYLMLCHLIFSSVGCLFTWRSLATPVSATHIALLVGQGLLGYGNQVRHVAVSKLTHGVRSQFARAFALQ